MNKKRKILWLTGQPGSGKTTLSNEIYKIICHNKDLSSVHVVQIDGDDLRDLTENKEKQSQVVFPQMGLLRQVAISPNLMNKILQSILPRTLSTQL